MKEINHRHHPFIVERRAYPENRTSEHSARVYELKDNPDYYAKKVKVWDESEGKAADPKNFDELRKKFEGNLEAIKKHLERFLPEFDLAYLAYLPKDKKFKDIERPENDAGAANAYMFVKKVTRYTGDASEQDEIYLSKAKDLDDFIEAAGELFKETFKESKNNLGVTLDLKNDHFIYGTTKGNPMPRLYFIDLYPRFNLSKKQFIERINAISRPYRMLYNFPKKERLIQELIAT